MMIYDIMYSYIPVPVPFIGNSGPSEKVGTEAMEVDQTLDNPGPAAAASSTTESHDPELEAEWVEHLRAVDNILSGEKTVALHQEFLIRNNHTDLQILKNTKVDLYNRSHLNY